MNLNLNNIESDIPAVMVACSGCLKEEAVLVIPIGPPLNINDLLDKYLKYQKNISEVQSIIYESKPFCWRCGAEKEIVRNGTLYKKCDNCEQESVFMGFTCPYCRGKKFHVIQSVFFVPPDDSKYILKNP